MRSVVVERYGEPRDVLAVRSTPCPDPGAGEVRLKLILSPIHAHDLEIVRGEYGHQPMLPMTPGTEAVGWVDALGAGVEHLRIGQRVCVAGARATWAEYFVARAASVVPLPEALSDAQACQLLAMPLSALMLFEDLAARPGDCIVQNSANGAIGRVINVLARQRGIEVLNLVRSGAAARAMLDDGHPHVLSTDEAHWAARVPTITRGAPLLRAIDSLGGAAASALLAVLAEGATLVSFGSMQSLTLWRAAHSCSRWKTPTTSPRRRGRPRPPCAATAAARSRCTPSRQPLHDRHPGPPPGGSFAMYSHVFVGVGDFDRALAFYEPVMAALHIAPRFCERERPWAGWQSSPGPRPLFLIGKPYDEQPALPGNGQMVAFLAETREMVDAAYAVALAHGGRSEGAPGLRPEYHAHYYGAYFRDPDGNKLCVACHAAPGG